MWWVHIIFISIEILIGVGLYVVFSTWNEYLELKRTGIQFCEVTLIDKSHRAVWLSNREVTDLPNMREQDMVLMYYSDGEPIKVSRDHIYSIREIKNPIEIVRKL